MCNTGTFWDKQARKACRTQWTYVDVWRSHCNNEHRPCMSAGGEFYC